MRILTLELINRGFINETDTQIFYYDKLFEEEHTNEEIEEITDEQSL